MTERTPCDETSSLATEQILRLDENTTTTTEDERSSLISRLRGDLQHERCLRKDVESRLTELRLEYDSGRTRSRDLNNQLQRIHTEVMTMRHEKTSLEARTQELSTEIAKISEESDYYKNAHLQAKTNYEKEIRFRLSLEQQLKEQLEGLDEANAQISHLTSDKRSRLIAEEQYRAALLERDRTIKRQVLESDNMTSRLADSSKISDNQRSDKKNAVDEIDRLKSVVKRCQAEYEDQEVVVKRLRDKISSIENQLELSKRTGDQEQIECKKLRDELIKKGQLLDASERDNKDLLHTLTHQKGNTQGIVLKHEEQHLLAENELFSVRDALRSSREQNSKLENELQSANYKISGMIADTAKSAVETKDSLQKLQLQLAEFEAKQNSVTAQNETLKTEKKVLLKKLKKERNSTNDKIDKFDHQAKEYKTRAEKLEPLIEKMAGRVDELGSDREKLLEKVSFLENENMNLTKELHVVHSLSARQVKYSSLAKESRNDANRLKIQESQLNDKLTRTKLELGDVMDEMKRAETENFVYINTISDLQGSKSRLEAKIRVLEDKERDRVEKLKRVTDRADEVAREAQRVARVEKDRNETISKRYRSVADKLRDRDLEIERLRSQIQIDQTLAALRK